MLQQKKFTTKFVATIVATKKIKNLLQQQKLVATNVFKWHHSLSGEILPQFDLNNFSVALKLGKLEKRPKKTLKTPPAPP